MFLSINVKAQDSTQIINDKNNIYHNWYNKSATNDSIYGAEVDKAYELLLKDKESTTVIVAVIDGGIDINHEDLKDNIWINKNEIPENGIDDDKNGYIDDINGWNFLANTKGENITYENLEITRIYKQYNAIYSKATSQLSNKEKEKEKLYQKAKKLYEKQLKQAKRQKVGIGKYKNRYYSAYNNIKIALNDNEINLQNLDSLKAHNKELKKDIKFLYPFIQYNFNTTIFDEIEKYIDEELDYHLNVNFNPRDSISANQNDLITPYGNNNVYGPDASHGTFVSGVIAAKRNNEIGINGIADNVRIMGLKAVPNGDERDKDVAKAIRYAVDNGAQIINMSFGKELSPQKHLVDEAFLYAEEKGVLLVHAAGNDGFNIDKVKQYPTKNISDDYQLKNWITVGASSMNIDFKFAAEFTNYGKEMVDLFAPGVQIKSLAPESEYDIADGTSFSAPVVSGVAALLLSYYPDLSNEQIKSIILKSAVKYSNTIVYKPGDDSRKPKKITFELLSNTAGLVNAYEAIKMAEEITK